MASLCLAPVTWADTDQSLILSSLPPFLSLSPSSSPDPSDLGWAGPCEVVRGCQQARHWELAETHPVCPCEQAAQPNRVPAR